MTAMPPNALRPLSVRIVWLTDESVSGGLRKLMTDMMDQAGLPSPLVHQIMMPAHTWRKRTQRIWEADPAYESHFHSIIAAAKPDIIICQHPAALHYLTSQDNRPAYDNLSTCRGSVYEYQTDGRWIPAICVGPLGQLRPHAGPPHTKFTMLMDLMKAKRFLDGEARAEPKFNLRICQTIDHIDELVAAASASTLLAMDIETAGQAQRAAITCDGYATCNPDGTVTSWVVPWLAPYNAGLPRPCQYWQSFDDEMYARDAAAVIAGLPVPKVMQNGLYDSHYYVRHRRPARNFIFDTAVMWHSIWPEIPKRLDFAASIAVDHYQYWKDIHTSDDKTDKKGAVKIPQDFEGCQTYWLYNGLDVHYTLLLANYLIGILAIPDRAWARENFRSSMQLTIGPAAQMSMTGMAVDVNLQRDFHERNLYDTAHGTAGLRSMADAPEFNPNSDDQVAALIYDVYNAEQQKRGKYKGRSANAVALALVATQSVVLNRIIQQLWKAKKPANNASKYGIWHRKPGATANARETSSGLRLWNGRWYYTQQPIGTDTWRFSSSASNWWLGTNAQNPPYAIRNMVNADPGMWMWEADYAQSDGWYTSHDLEEPDMIAAITDSRDTHCMHAAQFFQRPYDEIYAGYLADDPAITDPVSGLRQITKRIVYGASYLMAAYTLFLTMGREAVVAAGIALGQPDAASWDLKQLVHLCQGFLDHFFQQMYPQLKFAVKRRAYQVAREGSRCTVAFGATRTFFGDVTETDSEAQRKLAAFIGQGGTAGCINLAVRRLYYNSPYYAEGGYLNVQMHDSAAGQVPIGRYDLLDEAINCMQNPCTLHGRTFTVPVELKLGLGWGKRMIKYKPGQTTAEQIQAADTTWRLKHQEEMAHVR